MVQLMVVRRRGEAVIASGSWGAVLEKVGPMGDANAVHKDGVGKSAGKPCAIPISLRRLSLLLYPRVSGVVSCLLRSRKKVSNAGSSRRNAGSPVTSLRHIPFHTIGWDHRFFWSSR